MEIAIVSTELASLFILRPLQHKGRVEWSLYPELSKSTPSLLVKPLRRRKGSEEAWNDISCVANITAMQTGLISCYWEAPEMSEDN